MACVRRWMLTAPYCHFPEMVDMPRFWVVERVYMQTVLCSQPAPQRKTAGPINGAIQRPGSTITFMKDMRERRPGEQTCREAAHWVHLKLPQGRKLLPGQPGQLLLRQHLQHAHGSNRRAVELHTSPMIKSNSCCAGLNV